MHDKFESIKLPYSCFVKHKIVLNLVTIGTKTILTEIEEFAEALLDQLSIEINEEKDIAELSTKISEDKDFTIEFERLEDISRQVFENLKKEAQDFINVNISENLKLEFPNLNDFKMLKAKKVFATDDSRKFVDELFAAVAKEDKQKIAELIKKDTAKYLVYSTYAKNYISKISTTYGDILDDTIYLNKFVLDSYPKIILYKQGYPYETKAELVKSGYRGALKMTILEEIVHSTQKNLQKTNQDAVIKVNSINEECAKIILDLEDESASKLYDYLQLQTVPDDFPIAKRANLFFFLNPDFFLVEQLGPDVMTYTNVEIDPNISRAVPQLLDIYTRWLKPIQTHHAVFTTMEGMADFVVQNILRDDKDFQNYLTTFMGTDFSSYQVKKNLGKDFTATIFEKLGKKTFSTLDENPPNTREIKEPKLYLKRISQ